MSRSSRTLYVGNLPGDIHEREVEDLFYKFEEALDAKDAIRGRDGYDFDGHRLRIVIAIMALVVVGVVVMFLDALSTESIPFMNMLDLKKCMLKELALTLLLRTYLTFPILVEHLYCETRLVEVEFYVELKIE
ncbi:hypothetical protein OSB04_007758 [Centaurea solstitialis]|uniref:RRM domain-containing protein n=1 Tax=Centaurea solstitialis TaxID=347529 RepID=A0AA38U502_9ASTR|nr:hypothetical protein OSB04_007758 [Centaurea solstitialis]